MAKILEGVVTATKMTNTVVVEVTRQVAHPKYKKLLRRSKKFKVALQGKAVKEGDRVSIIEIKPLAKDIHFAIFEKGAEK